MTKDEIIKMALQCQLLNDDGYGIYGDSLVTFAHLVTEHEREACAVVCEELELPDWPEKVRQPLAAAIRAMSQ